MNYLDIERARIEAEKSIKAAKKATRQAADLIKGRLRSDDVPGWVLNELKAELRDWNMHTYQWRERK